VSFLLTPCAHLNLLASIKPNGVRGPNFYLLNGKIQSLQATRRVGFFSHAYEGRVAPLPQQQAKKLQDAKIGVAVNSELVFGKCLVHILVLTPVISKEMSVFFPNLCAQLPRQNTFRLQPFPSNLFQFVIYESLYLLTLVTFWY
jgi:hypothetical protein